MAYDNLQPEKHGEVTVVSLGPRYESLNDAVMQNARQLLPKLAEEVDPPKLLLDLRNTIYIDSSMIELFFRIWNRIKRRDGQFALCNLQEFPSKAIMTARLDLIWPIYAAREDALAAMAEKKE